MKSLYIYHQGTGTLIPLGEEVYLVNEEDTTDHFLDLMSDGAYVSPLAHNGIRIDNYNMTNLFFGE